MRQKIGILDYNNFLIQQASASLKIAPGRSNEVWPSMFIQNMSRLIQDLRLDSLVIACEGGDNWRREVYQSYKESRAERRSKSPINFKDLWQASEAHLQIFRETFPQIYLLKCLHAEGDDCIGTMVEYLSSNFDTVCISTDKDFLQLYRYPGFEMWNPVKREKVEVLDAEKFLIQKIILGDKSDCISSLLHGVGPKTSSKILESSGLEDWLSKNNLHQKFDMNRKLIDLSCIPQKVKESILEAFKKHKWEKNSRSSLKKLLKSPPYFLLWEDAYYIESVFSSLKPIPIQEIQ